MKRKFPIILGTAALLSTPALASSTCLLISQIYTWKALDDQTLIVEDNSHNKFKMSLMGYCPDLSFRERVGFNAIGGTQLSCLTSGDEVEVRSLGAQSHCPITSIVPYTPDMEKADKAAAAAKAQQQSRP